MVMSVNQDNMFLTGGFDADLETDSGIGVEDLLEKYFIGDGNQLAECIIGAAQLAAAKHMLIKAQSMQSAAEAENSA